jgi:hypothetical protein
MPAPLSRVASALLIVASIAAAQSRPAADDYKKIRLAEVTALVPKLEELVAWSIDAKLFRERDRLNGLIVALDSENAKARAALQYRRQKDGSWTRSPDWKEARNTSDKPLAELEKKRAEVADPVVLKLIAALEREKASMDPATRKLWLDELSAIGPDNAKLRELLGEVRFKGRWVLVETASAAERHPEAVALARAFRDGDKKIEDGKPDEIESKTALKWTVVRQGPFVRVPATIPPNGVDKALRSLDAAWQLTHKLFGKEASPEQRCTTALVRNAEEVAAYLLPQPETPEPDRGKAYGGYTLTQTAVVVVAEDQEIKRLRASTFRTASVAADRALGVTLPHWIVEGVSLHAEGLVLGHREPMYGEVNLRGSDNAALFEALAKPDAHWVALAAARVKDGKAPPLKRILALELFKITPLDSLFAATFAAYLIEGRPSDAVPFMRTTSRQIPPEQMATEALGITLGDLESRFHRWLAETSVLVPK